MEEQRRYQVIVFVYHYLVFSFFLVAVTLASGGAAEAWLLFLILMAVCYFVTMFRMTHENRKKKGEIQEKQNHFSTLVLSVIIVLLFVLDIEETTDFWNNFFGGLLIFIMGIGVFLLYLYVDYFHEKYLTMYANRCVSKETIHRFEGNTFLALKRGAAVAGIVIGVFFLIVISILSVNVETSAPVQQPAKVSQKEKKDSTKAAKEKKERLRELDEREKKNRSPFWEMLLKILFRVMQVLIVLLAVTGVAAIVFLLLKRLWSLRMPQFERRDLRKKMNPEGGDEYISLQPKVRKKYTFPPDNNGRIRECFSRYVLKRSDRKVDMSLTPQELLNLSCPGKEDPFSEKDKIVFRTLYEKARYSGLMCTGEEAETVRRMKNS